MSSASANRSFSETLPTMPIMRPPPNEEQYDSLALAMAMIHWFTRDGGYFVSTFRSYSKNGIRRSFGCAALAGGYTNCGRMRIIALGRLRLLRLAVLLILLSDYGKQISGRSHTRRRSITMVLLLHRPSISTEPRSFLQRHQSLIIIFGRVTLRVRS